MHLTSDQLKYVEQKSFDEEQKEFENLESEVLEEEKQLIEETSSLINSLEQQEAEALQKELQNEGIDHEYNNTQYEDHVSHPDFSDITDTQSFHEELSNEPNEYIDNRDGQTQSKLSCSDTTEEHKQLMPDILPDIASSMSDEDLVEKPVRVSVDEYENEAGQNLESNKEEQVENVVFQEEEYQQSEKSEQETEVSDKADKEEIIILSSEKRIHEYHTSSETSRHIENDVVVSETTVKSQTTAKSRLSSSDDDQKSEVISITDDESLTGRIDTNLLKTADEEMDGSPLGFEVHSHPQDENIDEMQGPDTQDVPFETQTFTETYTEEKIENGELITREIVREHTVSERTYTIEETTRQSDKPPVVDIEVDRAESIEESSVELDHADSVEDLEKSLGEQPVVELIFTGPSPEVEEEPEELDFGQETEQKLEEKVPTNDTEYNENAEEPVEDINPEMEDFGDEGEHRIEETYHTVETYDTLYTDNDEKPVEHVQPEIEEMLEEQQVQDVQCLPEYDDELSEVEDMKPEIEEMIQVQQVQDVQCVPEYDDDEEPEHVHPEMEEIIQVERLQDVQCVPEYDDDVSEASIEESSVDRVESKVETTADAFEKYEQSIDRKESRVETLTESIDSPEREVKPSNDEIQTSENFDETFIDRTERFITIIDNTNNLDSKPNAGDKTTENDFELPTDNLIDMKQTESFPEQSEHYEPDKSSGNQMEDLEIEPTDEKEDSSMSINDLSISRKLSGAEVDELEHDLRLEQEELETFMNAESSIQTNVDVLSDKKHRLGSDNGTSTPRSIDDRPLSPSSYTLETDSNLDDTQPTEGEELSLDEIEREEPEGRLTSDTAQQIFIEQSIESQNEEFDDSVRPYEQKVTHESFIHQQLVAQQQLLQEALFKHEQQAAIEEQEEEEEEEDFEDESSIQPDLRPPSPSDFTLISSQDSYTLEKALGIANDGTRSEDSVAIDTKSEDSVAIDTKSEDGVAIDNDAKVTEPYSREHATQDTMHEKGT